jgi:macrolide phosphotransferase
VTRVGRARPSGRHTAKVPDDDLLELVRRVVPDRDVQPSRLIELGWDHRVLAATVDGVPWIFRFPRRPDVDRERRLLQLVGSRLPVAVPDWQLDTTVGDRTVIGYPELPGAPAAEEPSGDGDFVFRIAVPPPPAYSTGLATALAADQCDAEALRNSSDHFVRGMYYISAS